MRIPSGNIRAARGRGKLLQTTSRAEADLRSALRSLACVALICLCHSATLAAGQQQLHSITTNEKDFLLDGKPFQIISGEMPLRADPTRILARPAEKSSGDGA